MAVAIRLSRQGSKKRPFYRIVAAEKSSPRDGRFIELLGTYDPRTKDVRLTVERYEHWVSNGAKPSETVASLYKRTLKAATEEAPAPSTGKPAKGQAKAAKQAEPAVQAKAAKQAEPAVQAKPAKPAEPAVQAEPAQQAESATEPPTETAAPAPADAE